jgi:hypothetical protein
MAKASEKSHQNLEDLQSNEDDSDENSLTINDNNGGGA